MIKAWIYKTRKKTYKNSVRNDIWKYIFWHNILWYEHEILALEFGFFTLVFNTTQLILYIRYFEELIWNGDSIFLKKATDHYISINWLAKTGIKQSVKIQMTNKYINIWVIIGCMVPSKQYVAFYVMIYDIKKILTIKYFSLEKFP